MGRKSRHTASGDVDVNIDADVGVTVDDESYRHHVCADGHVVEANSVDHSNAAARPVSPTSEEASKRAVKSVDFDAILKDIGEMGRYQFVLYLMMCTATLPAAFLAFNQGRTHADNLQHGLIVVTPSNVKSQSP